MKVKPNAKKNEVKKLDSSVNEIDSILNIVNDSNSTTTKMKSNHFDSIFEISTTSIAKDGEANKSVISMLSKYLRIGKTKFACVSGAKSRIKIFEISE